MRSYGRTGAVLEGDLSWSVVGELLEKFFRNGFVVLYTPTFIHLQHAGRWIGFRLCLFTRFVVFFFVWGSGIGFGF